MPMDESKAQLELQQQLQQQQLQFQQQQIQLYQIQQMKQQLQQLQPNANVNVNVNTNVNIDANVNVNSPSTANANPPTHHSSIPLNAHPDKKSKESMGMDESHLPQPPQVFDEPPPNYEEVLNEISYSQPSYSSNTPDPK